MTITKAKLRKSLSSALVMGNQLQSREIEFSNYELLLSDYRGLFRSFIILEQ